MKTAIDPLVEHYVAPARIEDDDPRLPEYSALGGLYTSATRTPMVWTPRQLDRYTDYVLPRELIVARLEMGRIAGALSYDMNPGDDYARVNWLAVKKDFRGTGIGASLLTAFEHLAEADGKEEIELIQLDDRSGAFYDKHGYASVPGDPERRIKTLR